MRRFWRWPRSASRSPPCTCTPQDIEWAWADGTLYLLQARPITSLFPLPEGLPADPLQAMLSFGAVQGMLDPITPLGRDLIEHIVAAGAQLFGMPVNAETQNALFTAGERLWINLTPLLRNTVGRRIMPGITSWVDPGGGAALDAIWHDPRLQPTRHGISPRQPRHIARAAVPLAGLVLLNLLSPDRRRRFIVERGRALAPRRGRSAAPRSRASRASGWPSWLIRARVIAEHLPPTFRLFVSGVASGMASFNLVSVLTRGLPGITDDRVLEITRGLPNNPTTEMDLALWQIARRSAGMRPAGRSSRAKAARRWPRPIAPAPCPRQRSRRSSPSWRATAAAAWRRSTWAGRAGRRTPRT